MTWYAKEVEPKKRGRMAGEHCCSCDGGADPDDERPCSPRCIGEQCRECSTVNPGTLGTERFSYYEHSVPSSIQTLTGGFA